MSAARTLESLRAELERRFGNAVLPLPGAAPEPERAGFRTGVGALDQLVPEGVPREALSLWTGEGTSGRTAALRLLVERACAEGALVAVVDATRTLDAAAWCGEDGASPPGLWMARPPAAGREAEGAWAAEQILRTGVFDLVVLDGPPPSPVDAHRLRALTRETGAALLVSTDAAQIGWRADLKLEFRREAEGGGGLRVGGRFRRRSGVRMAKGWGARTGERHVELVHEPPHRLHPGPFVPDRRPPARH